MGIFHFKDGCAKLILSFRCDKIIYFLVKYLFFQRKVIKLQFSLTFSNVREFYKMLQNFIFLEKFVKIERTKMLKNFGKC